MITENTFLFINRLLALVRLVVLGFFLQWRLTHPNEDAVWLWLMSVVCEVWFAFSWILDQIPKLCPSIVLPTFRFFMTSLICHYLSIPLAVLTFLVLTYSCTQLIPRNNHLPSLLAPSFQSYPLITQWIKKIACYVSDDGGAILTFEATAEAAFADLWVPFCRKHNIFEPKNPESYFSLKVDPTKNKSRLDFVKDRRKVKREFKVMKNGLPDSIRRRSETFNVREEMKMFEAHRGEWSWHFGAYQGPKGHMDGWWHALAWYFVCPC